jgi:hypothetical protein
LDSVTVPPYIADLAPSDFHLLAALKVAIHGKNLETDEDEIRAVRT